MKPTTYQTLAFALTLILLLALPLCAGAENINLFNPKEGPQALSVAKSGNTLYVMTNEGFFTWCLNDQDITCLADEDELWRYGISVDSLVFMANQPMILDIENENIWRFEEDSFTLVLAYRGTEFSVPDLRYQQPVYANGNLYVRALTDDTVETNAILLRVDIANGDVLQLPTQGIAELTAYSDDLLLGLQALNQSDENTWAIVTIDVQDGSIREKIATLPEPSDRGIAVSDGERMIFAHINDQICKWSGTSWEPLHPLSWQPVSLFYGIMDHYYVTASYQGLTLWDMRANSAMTTLTIRGLRSGFDADRGFMALYPNVMVQRTHEMHFCAEEVHNAIREGDTTDLFLIPMSYGVGRLIEKGFVENLSTSQVITQDNQRLYPSIASALSRDGAIYAVPINIMVYGWAMRNEEIEAGNAPSTLGELLRQQSLWEEDSANDGKPWLTSAFASTVWNKTDYARYLLLQYLMSNSVGTEILRFDTARFTELLLRIQDMPENVNNDMDYTNNGDEPVPGVMAADFIITLSGFSYKDAMIISPPTLTTSDRIYVRTRVYVYVLNPLSPNKENALRYLEYVAEHRDIGTQVLLCPDSTDGVLLPVCTDLIGDLRDAQAQTSERFNSASPENKQALKEQISHLQAEIDALYQDPANWLIYQPALNAYRESIAPYLDLQLNPLLDGQYATHAQSFADMLTLIEQSCNGVITSDQCISKLNAITRLVYGESVEN